jgi:hypothetical protein
MSTDPQGSVLRWIGAVKVGKTETAQLLGERYRDASVRQARARIGAYPRSAADECPCLLEALGDESLRRIVPLRIDARFDPDSAARLGYGQRAVGRAPELFRKSWLREMAP